MFLIPRKQYRTLKGTNKEKIYQSTKLYFYIRYPHSSSFIESEKFKDDFNKSFDNLASVGFKNQSDIIRALEIPFVYSESVNIEALDTAVLDIIKDEAISPEKRIDTIMLRAIVIDGKTFPDDGQ